jgi:hypothetical protein
VEPITDTSALPLSIAQVESTVYVAPDLEAVPDATTAADVSALHEQLLAAVVTRVGEVEAAEWAFDQAKAACDAQIRAALESGVPADRVAEAAGTSRLPRAAAGSGTGSPAIPRPPANQL